MTSSTTISGSKVGRARRRFGQLWQVPAFLIGVLALLGAAASAPWRHPPQWWEFDGRLVTLRRGLDQDLPGDQLASLADEIQLRIDRFPDRAAEAHFLVGSAYYRQALQKPAVFAEAIWPRALEHLEKAHERGLNDPDRAPLKYRLGLSLYQLKKDVPRAVELMTLSVDKGAEQPLDAYRLLVEANLGLKPANVDSALAASQRILDLTPEREIDAMSAARVQQGELLLRKHARAEAFKILDKVSPKAPHAVRVKARLLQTRACEEDGLWKDAVKIWQELLKEAPHVDGGRAKIFLAMGWCYHHMEPPNHPETIRVWSEALRIGGPEGQAAGLRLGELRLSMSTKNAADALADWSKALAKVNDPTDFKNPYIQLTEVSDLFKHAIKQIQELQDPEKMQQVADLYSKIAPGGVAHKHRAQAAEELAEQWLDKHKNNVGKISLDDVKAQFRRAAEAHEIAANALPDAERPDTLWRSVQCYLSAKDFPPAIKVLGEHLKSEKNETRRAESWFTLGDLYRAEGNMELAHEAFVKCIEIPDTKFAARSRFFLALEQIDAKDYEKACDILRQNLNDASPSFDRPAHERSLYKLGWLLHEKMRKYNEAMVYLKESRRLYPENPNVLTARDQLGDCYRQLALLEKVQEREILDQLKDPNLSEERRQDLRGNAGTHRLARVRCIGDALKTYQELADELEKQAAQKPLTPREQELLRRAGYGIGECHLDSEDFSEAMRVFRDLQKKNRRTLEGLYSCLHVCSAANVMSVRQLPKKDVEDGLQNALDSLKLLQEDIKGLPENSDVFRLPNAPTRAQWLQWHDATQLRLLAPPKNKNLPFP